MKISTYDLIAVVIINIGLMCLIAYSIYYTHGLWGMLGLFFIVSNSKIYSKDD